MPTPPTVYIRLSVATKNNPPGKRQPVMLADWAARRRSLAERRQCIVRRLKQATQKETRQCGQHGQNPSDINAQKTSNKMGGLLTAWRPWPTGYGGRSGR